MKVKQPIYKGIAKTPVVMQLEALECGAACLTMILAYFEKWVPLEQIRLDSGVSRNGSSAKNILKAARSYGLIAKGYRFELDNIRKECSFPCIIHWNFNHFVVLKGFKGKYAYLNDPGRGEIRVSLTEFDESFTGIALCFSPSENFVPSGKKKEVLDYLKTRTKGMGVVVAFVILTTIISNLLGIISPGFNRIFYDRLLTKQNPEWINYFLIAFILFSLFSLFISLINVVYSNKINGKITVVGSTSFMWKLMRLPIEFFSQRMTGDLLARENSNATISNTIVTTISPLVIDLVMMVFYLITMIRYNLVLTAVALFSTIANMFVSSVISKSRINATRTTLRDSSKLQSSTISGIQMIETIKASGNENGFFNKWSGYQASYNNSSVNASKAINYLGLIPLIVSSITSSLIMAIGIYLTINGSFTLGMITAFQGYLGSFMAPANSLINAGRSIQEMITELERLSDVMDYPVDPVFDSFKEADDDNYQKLSGHIEMRNVNFGYSRLDEPLIKDFNADIKPGSKIAFVGASGCGKSTISKLISGLVMPWSGEILYDGKKISEIDRQVFTSSISVVDQDIIIFEDTIKNNIKMWDDSIEDFEVVLAARDAQIHEDIMQREGGYDYKMTEGGKDFSGGQRQRLEIARVLAADPTICILDEATSALDAKTEYDTIQAIKQRGITCIIIAHRLSTIRDCDEIIVLDNGVVVERGTHEELMKLDGYYTQLITSD